MRDPNSTKSPYSIFDNGSNTFQREGNTPGYEEPTTQQIKTQMIILMYQYQQFSPNLDQASVQNQFIPRSQTKQV
jgi:hypothetical protein